MNDVMTPHRYDGYILMTTKRLQESSLGVQRLPGTTRYKTRLPVREARRSLSSRRHVSQREKKDGPTVFNGKTFLNTKYTKVTKGKKPINQALFPPLCSSCPSWLSFFPPITGEPKR